MLPSLSPIQFGPTRNVRNEQDGVTVEPQDIPSTVNADLLSQTSTEELEAVVWSHTLANLTEDLAAAAMLLKVRNIVHDPQAYHRAVGKLDGQLRGQTQATYAALNATAGDLLQVETAAAAHLAESDALLMEMGAGVVP